MNCVEQANQWTDRQNHVAYTLGLDELRQQFDGLSCRDLLNMAWKEMIAWRKECQITEDDFTHVREDSVFAKDLFGIETWYYQDIAYPDGCQLERRLGSIMDSLGHAVEAAEYNLYRFYLWVMSRGKEEYKPIMEILCYSVDNHGEKHYDFNTVMYEA